MASAQIHLFSFCWMTSYRLKSSCKSWSKTFEHILKLVDLYSKACLLTEMIVVDYQLGIRKFEQHHGQILQVMINMFCLKVRICFSRCLSHTAAFLHYPMATVTCLQPEQQER